MAGQCPLGNRGFPVVVNGVTVMTSINEIPNDIKLQFNLTTLTPLTNGTFEFSFTGNQSFWLGGSQYNLYTIRLSKPVVHGTELYPGGSTFNIMPYAELQFWGRPPLNSNPSADIAVMIVPLFEPKEITGNRESPEGQVFSDLIRTGFTTLIDLTKLFPENNVIRYTTCVEMATTGQGGAIENQTIAVAYWRKGISIWNNNFASRFQAPQNTLGIFGVPIMLTGNQPLYTQVSEVGSSATRTLSGAVNVNGGVTVPYTTNITATSQQFKDSFGTFKFSLPTAAVASNTGPTQYKCMAIDRQKDIVNGQVMVDPKTGKRLTESLQDDADDQDSLNVVPTPTITGGNVEGALTIFLGILGGTIGLAIVIWLITLYTTKKTPTAAAAAAVNAAATAALPTIHWLDLILPVFLGIIFVCILTIIITSVIRATKT
jgi:hypothetical protein